MQNFFGRKSEIQALRNWGKAGAIIVISGPPGVGKSAICEHFWGEKAIWLDAQFWDGDVIRAFYSALSSSLELFWKGDSKFVQEYVKDLGQVIIIDNAEYIDESKLHEELLEIRSDNIWVITTRRVQHFEASSLIQNLKMGALGSESSNEAAKTLFLTDAEDEIPTVLLEKLLSQLDYHPMSIKLCAAMTRWTGVNYIRDLVKKKEAGSIAPELWSSASLEDIFLDLWERLDNETCFFLERVSQMTMPISVQDLLVLFGQKLNFNNVMEELTGFGLININSKEGENWLQMTQALRVFCAQQFGKETEKTKQWYNELLAFTLKKHEMIWDHWERLDDDQAIEKVCEDRFMLKRLLGSKRSFFTQPQIIQLGLLVCVSNLANETMFEVIDLLCEIDTFPNDNSWPAAQLHCEILLYELSNDSDQKTIDALKALDKTICISDDIESVVLQWKIGSQLLFAKGLRNEISEAKQLVSTMRLREQDLKEKGIRIPEWVKARFEMRVGSLFQFSRQKVDEVIVQYERAVNLARRSGDRRSLAVACHNLGALYSDRCQIGIARLWLDEAQDIAFMGHSFWYISRISLGITYLREGKNDLARQTFLSIRALMDRTHIRAISLIELNLCAIALDEENLPLAREHLERLQQSERKHNDLTLELSSYLFECQILTCEGATKKAWKLSEEKRLICINSDFFVLTLCFYISSLLSLIVDDNLDQATEYLREAIALNDGVDLHMGLILRQLELFLLMKRSRQGKIKEQQKVFLQWLEAERGAAIDRQHLSSEGVRTVQYTMNHTLVGREMGFWNLFNRWKVEDWQGARIVDEKSGFVCSPDGHWIDLSRNQQSMTLLKTLVFHDDGQVISLEDFAKKLWPDQTLHPESVNNRLHVALSKLRSMGCNTWIERHNDGYRLDDTQKYIWIDGNQVYRSGRAEIFDLVKSKAE